MNIVGIHTKPPVLHYTDLEMAGAQLEYDESGSTFYYFLISFYGIILLPITYFLWPRRGDGMAFVEVPCDGC